MNNAVGATAVTSDPSAAGRSRGLALLLTLMGLVGMFFTLLGWTGHVRDLSTTWGASPTLWLVLGGVITLSAALADSFLGARADFVESAGPGVGATFLNRALPWVIVALTLVGMLVISLVHG